MKKFLFDFLTFEDAFINGGNLFAKTVLLHLLNENIDIYGVCNNPENLNDEIKSIIKQKNIKIYNCLKNIEEVNSVMEKEGITDFFIGISQRYNSIDLTKLNCKIYIICHDVGDFVVHSADLKSRSFWNFSVSDFWQYEILKKRKGKKLLKNFFPTIKNTLKKVVKSFHRENDDRDEVEKCYANFSALIKKDNVHVITVSNYSKYAIEYYFKDIANEIFISYPPFFYRENQNVSDEFKDSFKNKKYLLLLNADRPNKNINIFLKQYPKFRDRFGNELYAVIVGDNEPITVDGIINIRRVNDSELEYLMKNAFCLIYPSVSEGFGMPPIEAMEFGTPVIAAFDTSIPEVCGDGALYFNPLYAEDLYAKIIEMVENRQAYADKALKRFEEIKLKMESDFDKLINYILE